MKIKCFRRFWIGRLKVKLAGLQAQFETQEELSKQTGLFYRHASSELANDLGRTREKLRQLEQ